MAIADYYYFHYLRFLALLVLLLGLPRIAPQVANIIARWNILNAFLGT